MNTKEQPVPLHRDIPGIVRRMQDRLNAFAECLLGLNGRMNEIEQSVPPRGRMIGSRRITLEIRGLAGEPTDEQWSLAITQAGMMDDKEPTYVKVLTDTPAPPLDERNLGYERDLRYEFVRQTAMMSDRIKHLEYQLQIERAKPSFDSYKAWALSRINGLEESSKSLRVGLERMRRRFERMRVRAIGRIPGLSAAEMCALERGVEIYREAAETFRKQGNKPAEVQMYVDRSAFECLLEKNRKGGMRE